MTLAKQTLSYNSSNSASGLAQMVTWAGGKKNELKYILPNVPAYDRYFEPFVGGGSVFMGINAKEYYVNDLCSELISLYTDIATSNSEFFKYLEVLDKAMKNAGDFFNSTKEELTEIYAKYFCEILDDEEMKVVVNSWCASHSSEIDTILGELSTYPCNLSLEMCGYLSRRFKSMLTKSTTEQRLIDTHVEVAIKGALYVSLRKLYNNKGIAVTNPLLHDALFLYIRENVFGAKFTFNKKGEFCEAYGGSSRLKNRLINKINYFKSDEVIEHFQKTRLYNLDFEKFLLKTSPTENDFIFLDPPYDCPFSDYNANKFTRDDHKRLANYLLVACKAKWMMIINKTDFIMDLYNHPGIFIQEYDKKYSCNMKNNNNREAKHLLITNYAIGEVVQQVSDTSTLIPTETETIIKNININMLEQKQNSVDNIDWNGTPWRERTFSKPENIVTIGTTCSGIGAPEQALKQLGINHQILFAGDCDKNVKKSYLANYEIAEEQWHWDMRTFDATPYKGRIGIFVSGICCIPFSKAGKLKGTEDSLHGDLFKHFCRIVRECEPKVWIIENVGNMLTSNNGNDWERIKTELDTLGYDVHYQVLNAKNYGTPQDRERLFIIGFKNKTDFLFPAPVPQEQCIDDILIDKTPCTRRLFPQEALRLQGFENDFKIVVTDTYAYKQAGNSIPVQLIKAILQQMDITKYGFTNISNTENYAA